MRRLLSIIFTLFFVVIFISYSRVQAEDLSSTSFIIRNPTIDAGGGWSSSDSFQSANALGQNTAGTSTSASFEGQSGFSYIHDTAFYISAPATVSYSPMGVSLYSQEISTALDSVNITDLRGLSSGWTLSMAVTNLTTSGSVMLVAGSNDTVSFSGAYTGVTLPNTTGSYVIEITTSGARGTAVFKWTDPDGSVTENVTTGPTISLSNGLSVNFGVATYLIGDKWVLPVDSIGYEALALTPINPTINYGDQDVSAGATGNFTGTGITSNARTLINAPLGSGNGNYSQAIDLDQTVHPNTISGSFTGTIVLTLI